MVKTVNKTTPEEYSGAERLAEEIVKFIDFKLSMLYVKDPDYCDRVRERAELEAWKAVVRRELVIMWAGLGEEGNARQEYFQEGRPLEI